MVGMTTPGRGWKALRQYIKEEQARTSTQFTCHYQYWFRNLACGMYFQWHWAWICFFCQSNYTAAQKGPKNTTIRAMSGYTQIWDGFMWLTPAYGHMSTRAPLCWEQKNQFNGMRDMGWMSLELCSHSVTLKDSGCLALTSCAVQVFIR